MGIRLPDGEQFRHVNATNVTASRDLITVLYRERFGPLARLETEAHRLAGPPEQSAPITAAHTRRALLALALTLAGAPLTNRFESLGDDA